MTKIYFICLALVCAVVSCAVEAEASEKTGGLVLKVEVSRGGAFTFHLLNTTGEAISYGQVNEALGFYAELFDRGGNVVPTRVQFERYFIKFQFPEFTRLKGEKVRPGGYLEIKGILTDIFNIDDVSGCVLRVLWDPGFASDGRRHPVDDGLAVVARLQGRSGSASSEVWVGRSTESTSATSSVSKDVSVKREGVRADLQSGVSSNEPSRRWWMILVLAAFSIILIGAFYFRKGRKK